MSRAKQKLDQIAQINAAPAPAADPLDRLAERVNSATPDDIERITIRCSRAFKHTIARLASETGYSRNALVKLLLEQGVEELQARIRAKKN